MSAPLKAVVDLGVIPKNWDLDQWMEIADKTGYLVVDTYEFQGKGTGVQIIDQDNFELITIEEYEQRQNNKE